MSQGSRTSNEAVNVTVSSGATISRNTIIDTRFIPIRFNGNDVLIENNVIDGDCSVLDDGGGIYTWNSPKTVFSNRRVLINILTRGIGAKEGTISNLTQANGIYLDNNTSHVEVRGNTAYGMANKGFHTNSPQDIIIAENTFFDNQVGWSFAGLMMEVQEATIAMTSKISTCTLTFLSSQTIRKRLSTMVIDP